MATYVYDSSALEHCGFCYRQICGSHLLREVCEFCRKNFYESEAEGRAVHLSRMSPEARATYDRIRALREEIGPSDFDVVKALREIRDDDENVPWWVWPEPEYVPPPGAVAPYRIEIRGV